MTIRVTTLAMLALSVFSAATARSVLQVPTCVPSSPASNATTCPACGVAFGACCPDGTCHVGTTCVQDPLSSSKICAPCGNVGEDCCGGTGCADPRFPTICNAISKCEACGDIYLQCCRNTSLTGTTHYYCATNATTCTAVNGQFMCMPKPTEPNGKSCGSDADCVSTGNDSYICQDGGCQPCGTVPRRCCSGGKCRGDLQCKQGFCQPTGFLYNYCGAGSTCKNETWGKLTCNTTIDRCIPSINDLCPAAFAPRNASTAGPSSGPSPQMNPAAAMVPPPLPVYGAVPSYGGMASPPSSVPLRPSGTMNITGSGMGTGMGGMGSGMGGGMGSGMGGGMGNASGSGNATAATCGKVFAACCADGGCTDPATRCNGNPLLSGSSVCSPCGQLGEDCCTSPQPCRETQAATFCNSISKCEACGDYFLKCCPTTNGQPACVSGLSCSSGMCMPIQPGAPAPMGKAIPQQCSGGKCSNGLVCRDNFCHVCGDFQNYCCDGDVCNSQPWGNLKCGSAGRCVPA